MPNRCSVFCNYFDRPIAYCWGAAALCGTFRMDKHEFETVTGDGRLRLFLKDFQPLWFRHVFAFRNRARGWARLAERETSRWKAVASRFLAAFPRFSEGTEMCPAFRFSSQQSPGLVSRARSRWGQWIRPCAEFLRSEKWIDNFKCISISAVSTSGSGEDGGGEERKFVEACIKHFSDLFQI